MNATANLGKAPVRTLVLQLAIPSMTAQFVNVLYSIIDRMYIGHISENGALALAGAGICGPIVTLLTSFGTLVGIGGSITMGIRMGEKNHKKAEQVLANSFLMLSIFSVLLTVSFLLLKDKLLMLFGASGATFPFANTYLTIYTTGTFFALMATGLNYFINCQGFPLPVCLCRRADCPGMSKDRTCALRYQKISFCDQCSCPAFFLWCKSGFFRRTCC